MKANKLMLMTGISFLSITGCRDKTVWVEDSQEITVTSPTKNQEIRDNDSIRIEALIQPKSGSVAYYHLILLDNEKQPILNNKIFCDSNMSSVRIDTAFVHNINKTSNLLLQVHAQLKDGTYIRDETPFKLVDVQK